MRQIREATSGAHVRAQSRYGTDMAESRKGFLLGLAAYALWGLFPLYWPLLEPAGAVELLAHRVLWSMVTMVALILLLRRRAALAALLRSPRQRWILSGAAVVITLNWGIYIYGVTNEHVVETSLGYFINPLVTVLAGVVILSERLRPLQWVAVGLASAAVLGLTIDYGRPPWIALGLAFSFAAYGLLKKFAGAGAIESLTVETFVIVPAAAAYLVWLASSGRNEVTPEFGHIALIATSGLATAIPLICFGAAATRVPLSTLGLLQYVAPTLQFALGVLVLGEPLPPARLAGFCVVWAALALFTYEAISHHRRTQLALATAEPC